MGAPSLTNAFCLLLRFKTFIILLGVAGSVTRKRSRHRGCQINSYLSTSMIKREMNGSYLSTSVIKREMNGTAARQ